MPFIRTYTQDIMYKNKYRFRPSVISQSLSDSSVRSAYGIYSLVSISGIVIHQMVQVQVHFSYVFIHSGVYRHVSFIPH